MNFSKTNGHQTIETVSLELPLKTTVRHASASRKKGESIWVKVQKSNFEGFGEGCPRDYVAGDDIDSSLSWINAMSHNGSFDFKSVDDIRLWSKKNKETIDRYPSAWCAIETAFLDLFGRESQSSVEALLNLKSGLRHSRYTAVLGNDKPWKFKGQTDLYLIKGLTDFKVKLSGDLAKDQEKLTILEALAKEHEAKIRIRLDANNLWDDDVEGAIAFIKNLKGDFFAVEEPLRAGSVNGLSRFSTETGYPVILDESLCTEEDLASFSEQKGEFIANIKISRVGGLVRAGRLMEKIKTLGWGIIIGCHVGETSLLTRAGLIASAMAGNALIAHEGAFGEYLMEREPTFPTLTFRQEGRLNLEFPYFFKSVMGLHRVETDTWANGLGMVSRLPTPCDDGSPEIRTLTMDDGYDIHYRVWGENPGQKNHDVLLILHGGMSHSGWQAPLAKALTKIHPNLTVMAADRRGCGLNRQRGDLGTVPKIVGDVVTHVTFLQKHYARVHLAGWCQGAQFASIASAQLTAKPKSLILLTPGFFWNERFRSVLNMSEKVMMDLISEFKLKPERDHACIPVPMEPFDFTMNETWLDFIEQDPLKTTMITLKSANIMDEIQERSWYAILFNTLPTLAVIGKQDRIVDNNKVKTFIGGQFQEGGINQFIEFDTGHAVQFEQPDELAISIKTFLQKV